MRLLRKSKQPCRPTGNRGHLRRTWLSQRGRVPRVRSSGPSQQLTRSPGGARGIRFTDNADCFSPCATVCCTPPSAASTCCYDDTPRILSGTALRSATARSVSPHSWTGIRRRSDGPCHTHAAFCAVLSSLVKVWPTSNGPPRALMTATVR
ncbi:hypothetical protein MRX96_015635 [Rhipicephalus microplus]